MAIEMSDQPRTSNDKVTKSAEVNGPGAIAQDGSTSAGEGGVGVGGGSRDVIVTNLREISPEVIKYIVFAMVLIVGLAVIGMIVVVFLLAQSDGGDAQLVSMKTSTQTQHPIFQWCDDFNDERIDESRWIMPKDAALLSERNGVLNFTVAAEQSESTVLWATLEAIPRGYQIVEVSFLITLESYDGKVPGGTGIEIFLVDDRVLSVDVGPGPSGPGVEFSSCPRRGASYSECEHPERGPVPVSLPIPVRVVGVDGSVEFHFDGEMRVRFPVGQTPTTGFRFYLYADPGSVFFATIDEVCVKYTDE
jgi:hypothetical protein